MKKRLCTVFLSLIAMVLLFGSLGGVAEATSVEVVESGTCGDLEWAFFSDGQLVVSGDGPMDESSIPWSHLSESVQVVYIQDGVTTVAGWAFFDFQNLYTVRLPDSLQQIGDYAFFNCINLTWILNSDLEEKLPDGIQTIGDGAFCGCASLWGVTMGANVSYVGNSAFSGCTAMAQITLSSSLSYISDYAFSGCYQLSAIRFPGAVSYIGDHAFGDCYGIKTINFQGDAPEIHDNAFTSVYETIQATAFYPSDNASWTADVFDDYGGALTWTPMEAGCVSVGVCGDDVQWKLLQDGTLHISGKGAMYHYDTIDYPPWYSFRNEILRVVIEEGVTTIGNTAFYKCPQVQSVTIADSVTSFGDYSFMDCDSMTSIYISENVTSIGESVFLNCDNLQGITVAEGNPSYTNDAYGVLFDKSMETLIFAPMTMVGHYTIPDGVVKIGDSAFDACYDLTGVTIPSTVTTIGNSAFSCCFALKSVTIPASVTLVDHCAFWCCHGLEEINFCGDAPTFIEDSIFVQVTATAAYPAGNPTWTEDKFVHPESGITWVAVEPTITLQYPTLLLEDEIKMNVYFTIDQDISAQRLGILTWNTKPDMVHIATADKVIPGATYYAGLGYWGVTTEGIPAQNLGDEIYFCIYAELADGTIIYGKQVQYSPATYAYNQLNGSASDADKVVYVALLNYGAAAQVYLEYKTDALINANLTESQKALVDAYRSDMVHSVTMPNATKQGTLASNGGFCAKKPSISLDGAFGINYYFTPNNGVAGEMTFYYWNAADFEKASVLSADNATGTCAMTNENGTYIASIDRIAAKDVDGALYACGVYTDANGNTFSTGILPYSLGIYCANQVNTGTEEIKPLAAAIAVYGYYAAVFFASC